MKRIIATAFLTAALAPGGLLAELAVLSQVSPGVTLRTAALGGKTHTARPLQSVAAGTTLELLQGARAVLICSNDRILKLDGPKKWLLGSDSCQSGAQVPGAYKALRPAPGSTLVLHGSLLSQSRSRSDDGGGKVPTLLRPRSPQRLTVAIAEASPSLAWTAVRDAHRYDAVLKVGEVESVQKKIVHQCETNRLTEPLKTCTAAWPWSPLSPGQEVEIQIRAHVPDPRRKVRPSDSSHLRLLDNETRRGVQQRLQALAGGDLPEATRELLRATAFSEAELYNEAAEALSAAMAKQPDAALASHLGDLFLGLGQLPAALNTYQKGLNLRGGDDEVQAALHIGLGRAYVLKKMSFQAAEALRKAARLLENLGKTAEAKAIAREAEQAEKPSLPTR